MYNGEWHDMEVRSDEIFIKGESEPRVIQLYRTVHGPIIAQIDTDNDGQVDIAYSKKTSCYDSYISAVPAYTELMLAQLQKNFSNLESCLNQI